MTVSPAQAGAQNPAYGPKIKAIPGVMAICAGRVARWAGGLPAQDGRRSLSTVASGDGGSPAACASVACGAGTKDIASRVKRSEFDLDSLGSV